MPPPASLVGSAVTPENEPRDGYAAQPRNQTRPEPITLELGELPATVKTVLFQLFLDDFQAPAFGSRFQFSLNGIRIPSFETAINTLTQTPRRSREIDHLCSDRVDHTEIRPCHVAGHVESCQHPRRRRVSPFA